MGFFEADGLLRLVQSRAEQVDLFAQVVLTLAGRFQFIVHGLPLFGIEVGGFDVVLQGVDPIAADTELQRVGQAGVDDLGQAAEFLLDGLRLADQNSENPIFRSLLVDEVVAVDRVGVLELAVDAAVALFHSAGVPGHVEMEQVPAVRLKVQAFACRVGGDQDANRVLADRR